MSGRVSFIGALLCLPCLVQGEAAKLGRLFTTEAERETLQKLRTKPTPISIPKSKAAPRKSSRTKTTEALMLRGIVYRQDGRHSVWLQDRYYYLPEIDKLQSGWKIRSLQPGSLQLVRPKSTSRLYERLSLTPGQYPVETTTNRP